ncbi:hypothetical protein HDU78_008355 [Chytriomyces hyalinus]|nr:hypothetical protein HDU78_008355 [Chytriomyces hyalinus]
MDSRPPNDEKQNNNDLSVGVPDASESIQAALRAWNAINLTDLQKLLDSQGLEIVENQKESNRTKKKLSDLTKDFKKIPDEEKLVQFKSLLKAYQQEIDSITKRSKSAESAFLSLYKHLAEAPDPAPLISSLSDHPALVDQVAVLELENKKLKAELKESEDVLRNAKDDDSKIGVLKTRLSSYEQKLEDMVSQKVLEKEIEIKQATDEKIRIYKETEYSLQRQLNHMKDQLSNLQSSHDVTQAKLVDYSSQYDQEVATKLGELEIVVADLDRANQRAAQISRENDQLKSELAILRGDAGAVHAAAHVRHDLQDPVILQRKIKAQDVEISQLLEDLDKCKVRLNERESISKRRINELERELAVKKLDVEQMSEKLLQFEDYERIKRELVVMKKIEFSETERDGLWDEAPESSDVTQSLEKLLMDKNKRLQVEISGLKDSLDSNSANFAQSIHDLEHLKLQCDTQKGLISKLEEDLFNLNSILASSAGKAPTTQNQLGSGADGLDIDPLSQINVRSSIANQPDLVPVLGSNVNPISTIEAQQTHANNTSNSSIVPILASQRDRYRQRNAELEEQIKAHSASISDLKYNIESLKSDNVKLYEKLRYAESFQTKGESATSSPGPAGSHAVSIAVPSSSAATRRNVGGDDIQNRYNTLYETTLDPFQRFARIEQASRVQKLNPAEKAALVFTRILVGNKYTRVGFVVYSVLLHLLVFATLYLLSQWEECRHDHVISRNKPMNIH